MGSNITPLIFKNIDTAIFTESGNGFIITNIVQTKPEECPYCIYFENRYHKYKVECCFSCKKSNL